MSKYKKFLLYFCAASLLMALFTACSSSNTTASSETSQTQTTQTIQSTQTQTTGFESSNTAKLLKQDDVEEAVYIDADYIGDFSELEAQGLNVTKFNMIATVRDYTSDLQLYLKYQMSTDYGNIVMYADSQYLYVVNDYEKVNYRYNLGFDMKFLKSIMEGYEEFVKNVSAYECQDITLYNKIYRGEKFVKDGESQTWCYDDNGILRYIVYDASIVKINEYKFEFSENVFTLPAYHTVDTGESVVF